jgi:hypothetical protein
LIPYVARKVALRLKVGTSTLRILPSLPSCHLQQERVCLRGCIDLLVYRVHFYKVSCHSEANHSTERRLVLSSASVLSDRQNIIDATIRTPSSPQTSYKATTKIRASLIRAKNVVPSSSILAVSHKLNGWPLLRQCGLSVVALAPCARHGPSEPNLSVFSVGSEVMDLVPCVQKTSVRHNGPTDRQKGEYAPCCCASTVTVGLSRRQTCSSRHEKSSCIQCDHSEPVL